MGDIGGGGGGNAKMVKTEEHERLLCQCESILATKSGAVSGFRVNIEVVVLLPVR